MKNNESGSRRQVRPTLKNNNYKIKKLSYYENNSASKSSMTKQNQVEQKTRNNQTEGPINKTEKNREQYRKSVKQRFSSLRINQIDRQNSQINKIKK